MNFDNVVNSILRTVVNESLDSSYPLTIPTDFSKHVVYYTFTTKSGIEIYVQFTNEYAESVLSEDNNILAAFGRHTQTPQGGSDSWVNVNTEELLGVSDGIKILSTVKAAFLDYIEKFFEVNDEDTPLNIEFYGALTDREEAEGKTLAQSKRSNIYSKMFASLSRNLNHNLKFYKDSDGLMTITNQY